MIRLVTDYLDYAAEHFPDKEAFIDENKTLTFSDLQNRSSAYSNSAS